jgi:hypothetical protein
MATVERSVSCGNCNGGHGCGGADCCCPCHFDSSRNISEKGATFPAEELDPGLAACERTVERTATIRPPTARRTHWSATFRGRDFYGETKGLAILEAAQDLRRRVRDGREEP